MLTDVQNLSPSDSAVIAQRTIVIRDPTTLYTRRYITLWNFSVQKIDRISTLINTN